MASIQSLGVGSGLDVDNLVRQLVAAERQPTENRLARSEARYESQLSAIGSFKGALSALRDAAEALTASDGALQAARSAESGDDELFTVSADAAAALGTFEVEILERASSDKLASAAFADANADVGTGSLTLSVGSESFTVEVEPGAATLADIRDAINAAGDNAGVSATVLNESAGSRLILTGRETGAANGIAVTAAGGDGGLSALVYDPDGSGTANLQSVREAGDARVRIDGFEVSSPTNAIGGAIEGVTIDVLQARPGTVVTATIREDRSGAIAAVERFIGRFNALNDFIDQATAYDPQSGRAAPLLGDATVRSVDAQIQRIMGGIVEADAPFTSLPALGITTNASGRLELDRTALNAALDADPAALRGVLAGNNGIATGVGTYLDDVLAAGSRIEAREDGLRASLEGIEDERARLDRRIEGLEARYLAEFSALDSLVAQLNATGNFLNQQLSALPRPGGK